MDLSSNSILNSSWPINNKNLSSLHPNNQAISVKSLTDLTVRAIIFQNQVVQRLLQEKIKNC